MGTFRTRETEDKYIAFKATGEFTEGCKLCEAPALETFKFWRLIDNKFPYDRVADRHHMLVPIQHWSDAAVTDDAWAELTELKKGYLNEHYEFFIEAAAKQKSIPAHYHLHLVVVKEAE